MTKDEYWKAHVAKNPKFEDEEAKIQLTVGMLRKLMGEAYDKGFEHHKELTTRLGDVLRGAGVDLNSFRVK